MITFKLDSKYSQCHRAVIEVGYYPKMQDSEPDQVGWRVKGDDGVLGVPTVNLAEYATFPAPGCVFIKIIADYAGYLESMVKAGLIRETGRIVPAGFVERYASECEVLEPELLSAS